MYKVKQEDLIGGIKNFPIEVVQRMVECQVEQGHPANVKVFQVRSGAGGDMRGFVWSHTKEGDRFWIDIIDFDKFDVFFEKYPKKEYPKLMWVCDIESNFIGKKELSKRVVFMEKCGKYLAWGYADTLEEAEKQFSVSTWKYAWDIEEEQIIELTMEDISAGKGVGIKPHLIRIKK